MGTTVVVAISPVQRRCRLAKRLYRLPHQKSRNLGTPGESQHGIRAVHTLIDRRALQVSAVHISRVLSAASSSPIFRHHDPTSPFLRHVPSIDFPLRLWPTTMPCHGASRSRPRRLCPLTGPRILPSSSATYSAPSA